MIKAVNRLSPSRNPGARLEPHGEGKEVGREEDGRKRGDKKRVISEWRERTRKASFLITHDV